MALMKGGKHCGTRQAGGMCGKCGKKCSGCQSGGKKTRRVKKGKKTARKVQTRKYRKMTRKNKKHPRRGRKTRGQRGGGFLTSVAPETSRMMGATVNSVNSFGHTLTGHSAPDSNFPWVQDKMDSHLPKY